MYQQRTIEKAIAKASDFFPVVLISGPRQVGKTTVFKNCEKQARTYVSLDNLTHRKMAQTDPELFLKRFSPPVLIDEIQYAPELLPFIKEIVDNEQKSGLFWLTGSQQFHLMHNVTESLAGRVGILRLQGFSNQEKSNNPQAASFLPTDDFLRDKHTSLSLNDIFYRIWKGAYPKLYQGSDDYWAIFYESYVQTYIEKDILSLTNVSNELDFITFMKALAARTGQLLNYADLAKDVGVSQPTIKSWVSILQTSGLIFLLPPYSNNLTNRAIKTPKVYFMDTGLAAYLTSWNTPEALEIGAMNGALLETYVVSEIIKSYWHQAKRANIYFYRDKDKKEIDVILEENGTLYPIEIKKKSNPNKTDIKHFALLEKWGKPVGQGAVLCFSSTHLPITESVNMIPIGYL